MVTLEQLEEKLKLLENNFNTLVDRLTTAGIKTTLNFDDLIVDEEDLSEFSEDEENIIEEKNDII